MAKDRTWPRKETGRDELPALNNLITFFPIQPSKFHDDFFLCCVTSSSVDYRRVWLCQNKHLHQSDNAEGTEPAQTDGEVKETRSPPFSSNWFPVGVLPNKSQSLKEKNMEHFKKNV